MYGLSFIRKVSIGIITVICGIPVTGYANKLTPLDIRDVKVGGEIGRRIDITVEKNLLMLNVDKDFLEPFCTPHVIERLHPDNYIGMGKLIDSTVKFAAYTRDKRVLALKEHMVSEIIKSQLPDGYIGMFRPEDRMVRAWDAHEMVYLVEGLVSDYRYFGNQKALDAAQKLGDYIIATRPPQFGIFGMERAFVTLSKASGQKKYIDSCLPELQGSSSVNGHAYGQMLNAMAQLDLYDMQPDDKWLRQSLLITDYLRAKGGLVVTGTCSWSEGWSNDQNGGIALGETCATAYLIRVMEALMRIQGQSIYGDIMERTIYNSLFAAQSPEGRYIRYFTPFEGTRVYFDRDRYCCPCNFRRIIAELPGMIYYKSDGGVAVNLYTPSKSTIDLGQGVKLQITQETDYPVNGRVVLKMNPSKSAKFSLKLRIPRWCKQASLSVNGKRFEGTVTSGDFFSLERQWKRGDEIVLDMPMPCRFVKGFALQEGKVAVMRGPVVFSLLPGRTQCLALRDVNVLGTLKIDPSTLETPVRDDSVCRSAMVMKVQGWNKGSESGPMNLFLFLADFSYPCGEATYFHVPDMSIAVEDELLLRIPTQGATDDTKPSK
jgi:DUF1680 family protein